MSSESTYSEIHDGVMPSAVPFLDLVSDDIATPPIKEIKSSMKVGDRVTIRKDLKVMSYGMINCTNEMLNYCGKSATITNINGNDHIINIDLGRWRWSDLMFVAKEAKKVKKVEDDIYIEDIPF